MKKLDKPGKYLQSPPRVHQTVYRQWTSGYKQQAVLNSPLIAGVRRNQSQPIMWAELCTFKFHWLHSGKQSFFSKKNNNSNLNLKRTPYSIHGNKKKQNAETNLNIRLNSNKTGSGFKIKAQYLQFAVSIQNIWKGYRTL